MDLRALLAIATARVDLGGMGDEAVVAVRVSHPTSRPHALTHAFIVATVRQRPGPGGVSATAGRRSRGPARGMRGQGQRRRSPSPAGPEHPPRPGTRCLWRRRQRDGPSVAWGRALAVPGVLCFGACPLQPAVGMLRLHAPRTGGAGGGGDVCCVRDGAPFAVCARGVPSPRPLRGRRLSVGESETPP